MCDRCADAVEVKVWRGSDMKRTVRWDSDEVEEPV